MALLAGALSVREAAVAEGLPELDKPLAASLQQQVLAKQLQRQGLQRGDGSCALSGSIDFGHGWLDASGKVVPFRCRSGMPLLLQPFLRLETNDAGSGAPPPCWICVRKARTAAGVLLPVDMSTWYSLNDDDYHHRRSSDGKAVSPGSIGSGSGEGVQVRPAVLARKWAATPTMELDTGVARVRGTPAWSELPVDHVELCCLVSQSGERSGLVELSTWTQLQWTEVE
eukprot:359937-Chlamydomonas_euryale.AAC.36